jgi:hypothetical protein
VTRPFFYPTVRKNITRARNARDVQEVPMRLVHLLLPDGTIRCKGLCIVKVARPLPEAPVITPYPEQVTCPNCKPAKASA